MKNIGFNHSHQYCQYAQFLNLENKKPGTVQNYTSTIQVLHRLQGWQAPVPSQIHFKKLIECFKKERKEPVKQAEPMTHLVLKQLFEQVDLTSELEAVAWVSVLVGFCLLL